MICSKCKSKVKDNLSICPMCGAPLKKRTSKILKNKYIKNNNLNEVGGVVSNNSSFVNLKKKKVQQQVKRSDYYNYLDYKEAKEKLEDQQLAKSTKYKSKIFTDDIQEGKGFFSVLRIEKTPKKVDLNDYKKSLVDDNNPKTGANNAKIKFAKDSAEASIKSKRIRDYNQVGNAIKTKNYDSKLKNEEQRPVNNQRSYQQTNRNFKPEYEFNANVKKPQKKKGHLGDFLSYMAVMAIWIIVVVVVISANNKGYYFSTAKEPNLQTYNGVSKSKQEGNVSGLGVTSVIYDNQYLKQMVFSSVDDVNELIVSDSVKQKDVCPNDVKAIENEIINNYEIVAVNFCEMDKELATELRNVIAYIYNEFPNARNYLTNVTIANVGTNETFIAAFMPVFTFATSNTNSGYPVAIKTQIILNAKYFLNPTKLKNSVSSGGASGYFPRNANSSSTVAHEFGHYLSYVAMLNYYNTRKLNYVTADDSRTLYDVYTDFNKGNFSYKLLQEAYGEYQKNYLSVGTFDDFRKSISGYAMAKDKNGEYIYDETIAEAFHDYYLNGDNAKAASKTIVEVLKSKL